MRFYRERGQLGRQSSGGETKLPVGPARGRPWRQGACLTTRPFLPSGGLCHPRSRVHRHPCDRPVPRAVHSAPKAGQLHTGPGDARFHPELPAAGDAARRAAADRGPLQVSGRVGVLQSCPHPRSRTTGMQESRPAPSGTASTTREKAALRGSATRPSRSLRAILPEPTPSVIAQNVTGQISGCVLFPRGPAHFLWFLSLRPSKESWHSTVRKATRERRKPTYFSKSKTLPIEGSNFILCTIEKGKKNKLWINGLL